MKRSDMINFLAGELEMTEPIYPEKYAEWILDLLEEKGMLPPYSNPKRLKGYDIAYASAEELYAWENESNN